MASNALYQPTRYIFERDVKLPFSTTAPFPMHPGHSELLITGRVRLSPIEFAITIEAPKPEGNIHKSTYFKMHQRWNEDRTEFSYFVDTFYSEDGWQFSQYARFPSLKPESDFTISISTVQENPEKKIFHYKVRVNDDPVVLFRHRFNKISVAKIMINSPNDDIIVTSVQLDVTE